MGGATELRSDTVAENPLVEVSIGTVVVESDGERSTTLKNKRRGIETGQRLFAETHINGVASFALLIAVFLSVDDAGNITDIARGFCLGDNGRSILAEGFPSECVVLGVHVTIGSIEGHLCITTQGSIGA